MLPLPGTSPVSALPPIENNLTKNSSWQHFSGNLFLGSVCSWVPNKSLCTSRANYEMGNYHEWFEDPDESILCFMVVVTSENCTNWQAHEFSELGVDNKFPAYLPVEYLLGRKEGDKLTLSSEEKKQHFSLMCQQVGARGIAGSKPFEEVLKNMFMEEYHDLHVQYDKQIMTEKSYKHWVKIQDLRKKYDPSFSWQRSCNPFFSGEFTTVDLTDNSPSHFHKKDKESTWCIIV